MAFVQNNSDVDIIDWSGRVTILMGELAEVSDDTLKALLKTYPFLQEVIVDFGDEDEAPIEEPKVVEKKKSKKK